MSSLQIQDSNWVYEFFDKFQNTHNFRSRDIFSIPFGAPKKIG